jgi:hypothetical protein
VLGICCLGIGVVYRVITTCHNVKLDLNREGLEDVDWSHVIQDRVNWQAIRNDFSDRAKGGLTVSYVTMNFSIK